MRRLLTLVFLLCLAVPAGISITGCTRNPGANYCNGLGYGLKVTDVASIDLEPRTTGISLAFGQTQQTAGPVAKTCKGTSASVSTFTYGSTNNKLVDISPTGNICAGTWNRNSGGGIANYTICSFPSPLPNTGGLPYGSAYISASAQTITSNPVEVYIHPQVTTISLVGPQQCLSQGTLLATPLDAQACFSDTIAGKPQNAQLCAPAGITACPYGASDARCNNPSKYLVCPLAPGVSSVPTCTASVGTLTYNVGTASIASINSETNQITAEQPGTTVITASLAGSGSSAGYFSTCPPKSISVTLNGADSGTVTQGVQQNLTTVVTDTNGQNLTGLTLDYQSTNQLEIQAGSGGGVNASYPGAAAIYAICQPATCNPSPINQVGLNGTGLSISSNPVTVTTPGTASAFMWFAAPGKSQYIVPVELLSGTLGSTVRLPYVPNSMIMDQVGTSLYLGSARELMVVSTTTNTISRQDSSVPGVVLAVAPNNSTILINDPVRQVFYLYGASGTITSSFGGLGSAASWTPDSKTLYITDTSAMNNAAEGISGHTDTLYVYNVNTGWTTYPLPGPAGSNGAQNLALTVPSVGAYVTGNPTVAHTWCPTGTVGDYASMSFYPQGDLVNAQTDALAATLDGQHIVGAALTGSGVTLSDIGVTIPSTVVPGGVAPAPCPTAAGGGVLRPLIIGHTLNQTQITAHATALKQVIAGARTPASATAQPSNVAFITYAGGTAGATLPYYLPGASGTLGTVGYVSLAGSGAITAPIAGAFSPDGKLFFVSTSGDNQIHYINVNTLTDTEQISPKLPACKPVSAGGVDAGCIGPVPAPGTPVPATAIAVKPRSTT
jgi:hypothetical protein